MAIVEGPLKQVIFLHMDAPNEAIPDGFAVCNGATLSSSQQDINPGGTYTLPNLLNVFILGADPTKSVGQNAVIPSSGNINLPAGAPGPQGAAGSNSYSLSISELPSHTHPGTPSGSTTVNFTDPGHTHTLNDPGHVHVVTDPGHTHLGTSDTVANHVHSINDSGHAHQLAPSNYSVSVGSGAPSGYLGGFAYNSVTTASQTTGISLNSAGQHSHVISLNSAATGITVANRTTGVSVNSSSSNVTGQVSGLTLSIANTGGGVAFDNRPSYFGLVPIMRVKA